MSRSVRHGVLLGVIAGAMVLAPQAGAHSLVRITGSTLNYISVDDVSQNDVTITRPNLTTIRITDPPVFGGIDPGPCTPISPSEVECRGQALSVNRLHVEVGDLDDKVTIGFDIAAEVLGGLGNDTLTGAGAADALEGEKGDDTIDGGGGNDQLLGGLGDDRVTGGLGDDSVDGGSGADVLAGGLGSDQILARDGFPDSITCGEGIDTVMADFEDQIPLGETLACENTQRANPSGGGGDTDTPPRFKLEGPRSQRAVKRGYVLVIGRADRIVVLRSTGTVRIAGRRKRVKLRSYVAPTEGPNSPARLELDLTGKARKAIRAALKRRKKVTATVTVTARDNSGNEAPAQSYSVRIKR